ncbi:MAG: ABC transporter permease [Kiritimatiellae bacterium]|nr:ABC transporter permease [Kiritimatiellia bacterium]
MPNHPHALSKRPAPRLVQARFRTSLQAYRIYWLLLAVLVCMSLVAPRFLTLQNLLVIVKGASLNAVVAIGFTIVMICGEMDLSIGATLTLGAMLVIGLRPALGWTGALAAAVLAGALTGYVNGLLVSKAKINSFIVTLGTLTVVQGLIYMFSHGASLSVTAPSDFALADFLEQPLLPLVTRRVLISLLLVAGCHGFMACTRPGRNFHMVGGNRETAWVSGINPNRYLQTAFALSGSLAALGGALFAMSMSSATTDLGTGSLMDVISATIIGGTAMSGGKGSVLRSAVAVLTFAALFNGFNRLGFGSEFRIFVAGVVLALVVLHEAWTAHRQARFKGQRAALIEECRKV